jgi:hypothetical protein
MASLIGRRPGQQFGGRCLRQGLRLTSADHVAGKRPAVNTLSGMGGLTIREAVRLMVEDGLLQKDADVHGLLPEA